MPKDCYAFVRTPGPFGAGYWIKVPCSPEPEFNLPSTPIDPVPPKLPDFPPYEPIDYIQRILYILINPPKKGKPNYHLDLLKHDLQEDIDRQRDAEFMGSSRNPLYDPSEDMEYDPTGDLLETYLWMLEEEERNRGKGKAKHPEQDPTNPDKGGGRQSKKPKKCHCVQYSPKTGWRMKLVDENGQPVFDENGKSIEINQFVYDATGNKMLNPDLEKYGIKLDDNPQAGQTCGTTSAGREETQTPTDTANPKIGEKKKKSGNKLKNVDKKPENPSILSGDGFKFDFFDWTRKKPEGKLKNFNKTPTNPELVYRGGIASRNPKQDALDLYADYASAFDKFLNEWSDFSVTFPKDNSSSYLNILDLLNRLLEQLQNIKNRRVSPDYDEGLGEKDPAEKKRVNTYLKQLEEIYNRGVGLLIQLRSEKPPDQDKIDKLLIILAKLEASRREWEAYLASLD